MRGLAIGIMSGTSLDGVDAVLADMEVRPLKCIASSFVSFPSTLRSRLLALSISGSDGLDAAGSCTVELSDAYAVAVGQLLADAKVQPSDVMVIGCHGQTVRHRPDLGFSIQLNGAARLAERTGIDVVADFRSRDIAAGGQGAPLVPLFHDAMFRHDRINRAIVNIGGISNISSLRPNHSVIGFDCGPGNVLMDAWTKQNLDRDFDEGGRWASEGRVLPTLLERMLDEPFIVSPPPKSTGRELFNGPWLRELADVGLEVADVQATLLEFTARAIVESADRFCAVPREFYLCGGGARNGALVARVAALASPRKVSLTDELGVPAEQVEALAFAWLALKCIRREKLDLTTVTGASHPCILGAVYPA